MASRVPSRFLVKRGAGCYVVWGMLVCGLPSYAATARPSLAYLVVKVHALLPMITPTVAHGCILPATQRSHCSR